MTKIVKTSFFLWLTLLFSCQSEQQQTTPTNYEGPLFELLSSEQTGITFNNARTETPKFNHFYWNHYYSGGGVALGDLNNDGLQDVVFSGNQVADKVYFNKGNFKFEDVSEQAGILDDGGYSMGVTLGDVNQDGFLDIYICRYGLNFDPIKRRNLLYVNNRNGTFTEKAKEYGLDNMGFSTQATFFDMDRDGDLDLYLGNQAPDQRTRTQPQMVKQNIPEYTNDRLFENKGNFTFEDITEKAGIDNSGFTLNAMASDINEDGWPDIYVTCDYESPDFYYINNGDNTFTNKLKSAFQHTCWSTMGSDIADFNNDGALDILAVDMAYEEHYRSKTNMPSMQPARFWHNVEKGNHFQYMQNTLQLNNGNGSFSEVAQYAGIAKSDWSWSVLMVDFDNDGWRDVAIANGVKRDIRNNDFLQSIRDENAKGNNQFSAMELISRIPSIPVKNVIYRNNQDLTFSKKSDEWGFNEAGFSQGMAYADLDNDGDLDLVTNNDSEVAFIYENKGGTNNNYLRIKCSGEKGNANGLGVKATLEYNNQIQVGENTATRGYFSSSEPIIHFGLGDVKKVDKVTISWPNGKQQVLTDVAANQVLEVKQKDANEATKQKSKPKTLLADISKEVALDYQHQENEYDDFAREILLPHKQSNNGPHLSVGDVNQDGLDDFYVGGAAGFSGNLYLQNEGGSFTLADSQPWNADKNSEDLGSILFDADGDKDLDLYVVSGGSEFDDGTANLMDRLYLNDGNASFNKTQNALPNIKVSGQKVVAQDIDGDGDLDLFVGGRLIPGKYPQPAYSYILQNDGKGRFTDVTKDIAPDLARVGLVTDAIFSDYDGDKDLDLMVVGEWMPITIFKNEGGKFSKADVGLADEIGWWWSLIGEDFDQDGDIDYIVGNLGKNHKYKGSKEEPLMVFDNDFDGNGTNDIVLAKYSGDKIIPVRGRECSSDQMPFIAEKFPTFEGFATATLETIYPEDALKNALKYEAKNFKSVYLENNGNGQFTVKYLPSQAQFAPIQSMVSVDVNQDGFMDVLGVGNLFSTEVETVRHDAGIGICLLNDGKGNFTVDNVTKSGFFARNDAKCIKKVNGKKEMFVVGNNAGPLQFFVKN